MDKGEKAMMKKLGDIATYVNGYAFKPNDWSSSGLPIIRIQDLTGNSYEMNHYDDSYDKKYEVNPGDVLISWSASLGVYIWHGKKALLNQHIFKVIFNKEKVNKEFFAYQVENILKKAASQAHGATMRHLTKSVFSSLPFYLPEKEEQDEIAANLGKVADLIKLRKQQLNDLDEMAQSRFIEMFGDNKFPKVYIEDVCSKIVDCPHTTPKYYGELKYPSIRTTEIKSGYIEWNTMKYVSEDEYKRRTTRLRPTGGDIVYCREGTYGNAAILPEGYSFCLGQRVMLFRADSKICCPLYLLHALISDDVKRQADYKNAGSTVPHVNVSDAKKFTITLPPLDLQNQFARFVKQLDKSKLAVQKSLDELEILKKSLMQKYFG